MTLESWRWRDPFEVVASMERHAQKQAAKAIRKAQNPFGERMTEDQSATIDALLQEWWEHSDAYRPALGAPKVSAGFKDYRTGETRRADSDLRDDRDAKLREITCDAVGACIDTLIWQERTAIDMHCAARQSGYSVIKNPRLSREEHVRYYGQAKLALLPMLRSRELLR